MVTRKEIEILMADAQQHLNKVVEYVRVNERGLFSVMDLKMHDASYYSYSNAKDYPLIEDVGEEFYHWCEDEYDINNTEFNFRYGFDMIDLFHHIGRTSKFYLLLDMYNANKYGIINEVLSATDDYFEWLEFDSNDNIIIDFDSFDDYYTDKEEVYGYIYNELKAIVDDEIYTTLMNKLENDGIIYFYNLLSDLKKNQVEYFKEYLECVESDLEYDKELEEKREVELQNKKLAIKDKYSITDEDWQVIME